MAVDTKRHSAYTGTVDAEVIDSMVELLGDMDWDTDTADIADLLYSVEVDYGRQTATALVSELAVALAYDEAWIALTWQYGRDRARAEYRRNRSR